MGRLAGGAGARGRRLATASPLATTKVVYLRRLPRNGPLLEGFKKINVTGQTRIPRMHTGMFDKTRSPVSQKCEISKNS